MYVRIGYLIQRSAMFACVFYVPRRVTTELFECVHCCYLDSVWINVSNVKISPSRNPNQSSAHHAHWYNCYSVESCSWFKLQQIWDFQSEPRIQTRFLVCSLPLPPPCCWPGRVSVIIVIHGRVPRCSQEYLEHGSGCRVVWRVRSKMLEFGDRLLMLTKEIPTDKLGCQSMEEPYSAWTWITDHVRIR